MTHTEKKINKKMKVKSFKNRNKTGKQFESFKIGIKILTPERSDQVEGNTYATDRKFGEYL